jgi:23S rRNA (cytidine1920-2'-O)/16S rRNA (cytidine1409-2'-O)-methyltransferase
VKSRVRLDVAIVERGLEESRARAQARIIAGQCLVDGQVVTKPGTSVKSASRIELTGDALPFVSRGGLKLDLALERFPIPTEGVVAMDVGASTGGFTDCLLQRGVARVYAIDVGYGQLAWSLRQDPRVVVMERTNIRTLSTDAVAEPIELAVIDCSFISLRTVLPATRPFLAPGANVVALIKPQFEAGRSRLGGGGVVRDEDVRREIIEEVVAAVTGMGFEIAGSVDSETPGPKGNVEHLLWCVNESASP